MNDIIKGYYYHYKHNNLGEVNNYAYEVVGIGQNTETDELFVIYRPLYKSDHLGTNDFYVRPYKMFNEFVNLDGKSIKRFSLIEDNKIISELKKLSIIDKSDK